MFASNTANSNTWWGFAAWNSSGDTWTANTANNNTHWGFALWNPCTGETVTANVARSNGDYDALETNSPLNTWTNNNFGTTSPANLQ